VHFIFGGNSFNDFPEIVPTTEITTKIEDFSRFLTLFLEWAQCCSINSSQLNQALAVCVAEMAVLKK